MKKSAFISTLFICLFACATLVTACAECVPSSDELNACDGEYDYENCQCIE